MLDLILRGAAIGTIVMLSMILLFHHRGRGPASVACCGTMLVCYLIISAPAAAGLSGPVWGALIAGAILAPLGLTWMMMELLTDKSQRGWPWLVLAAMAVMAAPASLLTGVGTITRGGLVILLYGGLITLAILSDRDDLVASRRRFRRGFLAVMGMLGVVITVFETTGLDQALPDWVFPLQAAVFWALGLTFGLWALRPDAALFLSEVSASTPPGNRPRAGLINRLNAAMSDGLWLREGLTIGALALELNVPEHRLRATINQELGHRNFSTYINGHRIEAAKVMLRDPQQSGTTVLEIAFACGFSSLGPFNKAFRAQTGQSPTEFRAHSG